MKNTSVKSVKAISVILSILLFNCACAPKPEAPPPATDPYAGQVLVSDGRGNRVWVPLYEDIPAHPLSSADFHSGDGNTVEYTGNKAVISTGIDVSFYQGDIDWEKAASDGVQFAIIRAGYRGWSKGDIFEDETFERNIEGAATAGIAVGVYFFSQAINTAEAQEEAEFVLMLLNSRKIDLPVMFDWERVETGARTDGLSGRELTDCCIAFCNVISEAGYEPGVYFYRDLGYNTYELDRLNSLVFWVGAISDHPDFYYRHSIWQYSITGRVAGIEGNVDLNIRFIKMIGSG
ncbi:MAG: glycoside hydrolase family 25 protein [Oscillospiraceae bacterium]|nr:glycoside hydrolase family 25 protein [Oscillospiraceae bacterium]